MQVGSNFESMKSALPVSELAASVNDFLEKVTGLDLDGDGQVAGTVEDVPPPPPIVKVKRYKVPRHSRDWVPEEFEPQRRTPGSVYSSETLVTMYRMQRVILFSLSLVGLVARSSTLKIHACLRTRISR